MTKHISAENTDTSEPSSTDIGAILAAHWAKRYGSQTNTAKALGVSPTLISHIKTGKKHPTEPVLKDASLERVVRYVPKGAGVANVREMPRTSPLPPDLPGRLRQMADDVESGRVTAMVVGYVCDDNYEFLWPSSLTESLTIATLTQARALDRFRQ